MSWIGTWPEMPISARIPLVGEQAMRTGFAEYRIFRIVFHEELESGAQTRSFTLALTMFVGGQPKEIEILKKEFQKLFIITSSVCIDLAEGKNIDVKNLEEKMPK